MLSSDVPTGRLMNGVEILIKMPIHHGGTESQRKP